MIFNFINCQTREEKYDANILNEAIVYEDIYKQNNRKNCALLPYKGLKEALENYLKTK